MKTLAPILLVVLLFTNASAVAQDDIIQFPSGSSTATVKGHTNPLSSKSYKLTVKANQRVAITLTSTSRKKLVRFEVKRNHYTGKPLAGTDGVTVWEGVLARAGDYWVNVYALPDANEEDFTLSVTLK